jgi:hypothetical protein
VTIGVSWGPSSTTEGSPPSRHQAGDTPKGRRPMLWGATLATLRLNGPPLRRPQDSPGGRQSPVGARRSVTWGETFAGGARLVRSHSLAASVADPCPFPQGAWMRWRPLGRYRYVSCYRYVPIIPLWGVRKRVPRLSVGKLVEACHGGGAPVQRTGRQAPPQPSWRGGRRVRQAETHVAARKALLPRVKMRARIDSLTHSRMRAWRGLFWPVQLCWW